jgi:hypothetical protein
MRFDAPRLMAWAAAAGLAASPLTASPTHILEVPMCGTSMKTRIPLPGKPRPAQDCPSACHAVTSRRCDAEDDPG